MDGGTDGGKRLARCHANHCSESEPAAGQTQPQPPSLLLPSTQVLRASIMVSPPPVSSSPLRTPVASSRPPRRPIRPPARPPSQPASQPASQLSSAQSARLPTLHPPPAPLPTGTQRKETQIKSKEKTPGYLYMYVSAEPPPSRKRNRRARVCTVCTHNTLHDDWLD